MDRKLNGINSMAYMGVVPLSPPELVIHPRPPTANDFRSFELGTIWIDCTNKPPDNDDIYMLVSVANRVATWVAFGGSPLGSQTITGDSGGPVSPDGADNTNLFSGIVGLSFDGNPGAHTITLNSSSGSPLFQSLSDDASTLVYPDATGDIGILGTSGHIISTAGVSALTLDLSGTIASQYTTDAGIATPAAGNLNVLGGTAIATSGAGSTVTIATTAAVATTYQTDSGNAIPAAHVLKIIGGTNIATSAGPADTVNISTTGGATVCSFSVFMNGTLPNATGDDVAVDVPYDTAIFDTGSDFNLLTHLFTAPVNGVYVFTGTTTIGNALMGRMNIYIICVGPAAQYLQSNTWYTPNAAGQHQETDTWIISMTAGQTAKVRMDVNQLVPAHTVSLVGGNAAAPTCVFSGALLM